MSAPKPTDRLPRGPHRLSRTEVAASQRSRMISAMIDAVAEKGYPQTTVGDILSRAGVSRATFYEQFDDKADCFGATYTSVTGMLAQVMDAALTSLHADSSAAGPVARIDALIGRYLDLLGQSPSLAKVFLVEVYASGPKVLDQRRATVDAFVELVVSVFADTPLPGTPQEQYFTARALVTALVGLATEAVASGELDRLADIREPFRLLVTRLVDPAFAHG